MTVELTDDDIMEISRIKAQHIRCLGGNVNGKLESLGENTVIFPSAKIVRAEVVSIGKHAEIGDYVFIYGGEGITIGDYTHIAAGAKVIGGGELETGKYVAVAYNAVLITGTDTPRGGAGMTACLPDKYRNPHIGKITIRDHGYIGSGAVVMPDVLVDVGAVVGACSFVKTGTILDPWTVYAGCPVKEICKREPVTWEVVL